MELTDEEKTAVNEEYSFPSNVDFAHTDALSYLLALEDNSVDLILTDPPYAISKKTGFKGVGDNSVPRLAVSMSYGNWDKPSVKAHAALMDAVMKEYYRVLKKGGTLICWYDLWKLQTLSIYAESANFKQLRMIEWLKTNPVPLNSQTNYLTNSREIALVAVKGSKPTFHSKYDNGVYKAPIHRDGGKRLHPTQKPLGISRELIEKHSNKGDVVLDTFAGSATHLVAALQTGRIAKGCEPSVMYYKRASKRIQEVL